jgi:hypothetical protein
MVEATGYLWGKSPRITAGNGPACVKAFVGPLPPDEDGYTFETDVAPTRHRKFFGIVGAVWEDGDVGVEEVPENRAFVRIPVRVIDG